MKVSPLAECGWCVCLATCVFHFILWLVINHPLMSGSMRWRRDCLSGKWFYGLHFSLNFSYKHDEQRNTFWVEGNGSCFHHNSTLLAFVAICVHSSYRICDLLFKINYLSNVLPPSSYTIHSFRNDFGFFLWNQTMQRIIYSNNAKDYIHCCRRTYTRFQVTRRPSDDSISSLLLLVIIVNDISRSFKASFWENLRGFHLLISRSLLITVFN